MASAVVLTALAWLDEPGALRAADAVQVADSAYAAAGADVAVEPDPEPGTYAPQGEGPVDVWRVRGTLDGDPLTLSVSREDGQPVFLDDRSPAGDRQLLSDVQAEAIASHRSNPALDRQLLRNVLATVAAALIALIALRAVALSTRRNP